jgi:hypothetical protein
MKTTLTIFIDEYTAVNLNADFFGSPKVQYLKDNSFQVHIQKNTISKLIKKKMQCMVELEDSRIFKGIIINANRKNSGLLLTCQFSKEQDVAALFNDKFNM